MTGKQYATPCEKAHAKQVVDFLHVHNVNDTAPGA